MGVLIVVILIVVSFGAGVFLSDKVKGLLGKAASK